MKARNDGAEVKHKESIPSDYSIGDDSEDGASIVFKTQQDLAPVTGGRI